MKKLQQHQGMAKSIAAEYKESIIYQTAKKEKLNYSAHGILHF